MGTKSDAYSGIKKWYQENLSPIFDEINAVLIEQNKKNNTNSIFVRWWAIFYKNSMVLFELLTESNQSYQINMTIRLLMEMAADLEFINKNRENISKQQNLYNEASRKAKQLDGISYAQFAEEGKKFHLFYCSGGKKGKEAKTVERIKAAYNQEDCIFYEYLNCFTHFNYLGAVYDLALNQPQNLSDSLKERMRFLQFYPTIFEKEVHAIGDLCNIDELRNYDCSRIYDTLAKLESQCRYDLATPLLIDRGLTPSRQAQKTFSL